MSQERGWARIAPLEPGRGLASAEARWNRTEHRRNERDLAETEARLRDLTDTIPGAISQLRYHRAEGDDIEGPIRRTAPHVLSYRSTGKIEVSHRLHGQRPYACG